MIGAPGLLHLSGFIVARDRHSERAREHGASGEPVLYVGEAGGRMLRFDVSSRAPFLSPQR